MTAATKKRIWRAYWWLTVSLAVATLIRLGLPNRKSIADLFFQSLNALIMIGWASYMLYKKKGPSQDFIEGSPEVKQLSWQFRAIFFILGVSPSALRKELDSTRQTSLLEAEPGNRDQKVADAP